MTAVVERVTTTWRLDPPVDVERCYQSRRPGVDMIRVHLLMAEVDADGTTDWSVKGVPLTSKGNPNGGIDRRSVTDAAMDMLRAMVEPWPR